MGDSEDRADSVNEVEEIQPFELAERLEVGLKMTLVAEAGGGKRTSYEVEVKGWEDMGFILTSVPERKSGMVPLRGALPVTVRMLAEGVALGFRTRIMDIQSRPVNVMYLQYPGNVAMKDVRAHKRFPVFLIASITIATDDHVETGKGIMRDLAVGGCCIETEMDLPDDEEVTISFTLPNGVSVKDLAAIVRNQRETLEKCAYGMQYVDDDSTEKMKAIRGFFDSIGEFVEDD